MSAPHGNCTIRALHRIEQHPEKLALWSARHGVMSFGRFGHLAAMVQSKCADIGLHAGDPVVVMALPSPMLYSTLVALMGFGCPVVFIEPWMPAKHISSALKIIGAKAFFADAFGLLWGLRSAQLRALPRIHLVNTADEIRAGQLSVVPVNPQQPAIISFTSGTTGQPKGVVRTHEYLWSLHEILVKYGQDDQLDGPDLTIFPNLALFHIGTGRGSLLVPQSWSLSALRRMMELDRDLWPQSLSCGPAFLKRLLDYDALPQSLRHVHVGGALVECELLENAMKLLPRASIKQVYGGTEVEPIAICDARVSVEKSRRKGFTHALNIGFPIDEIRTKWDEQGVLWVSGPNVCSEYLADTRENLLNKQRDDTGILWHCTGDRILSDDEGLWFAGRAAQTFDDFLFEQKLYTKLGHTRAFIHRDLNGFGLVIADDGKIHVQDVVRTLGSQNYPVWDGIITRDRRHRSRIDRAMTWERSLRMRRWRTYLKERSPLFVLFALSAGPLVSGFFLSQVLGQCTSMPRAVCLSGPPSIALSVLAILASVIFMILARMMDELKDFEKDKIANPTRPLPRGLISPSEMNKGIFVVFVLLMIFTGGVFAYGGVLPASLLLASCLYLWLMYKEFYIGKGLADYPLVYALSHQAVGVPLYLFGVSLFAPAFAQTPLAWIYVGTNVAASVSYEFTRKLKPDAHPAANTYRHIYGLKKAGLIAFFFQVLSIIFTLKAHSFGFVGLTVLLVAQVLVSFLILFVIRSDTSHKLAEGLTALVVLLSAWMGIFVVLKA